MCNDYAREIEAGRVIAAMEEMKDVPPFSYTGGRIPNDAAPTPHIKIRDKGLIVWLREERLDGEMVTWAWLQGKRPVFNFVSEDRDFSKSDRCLILATSFAFANAQRGILLVKTFNEVRTRSRCLWLRLE